MNSMKQAISFSIMYRDNGFSKYLTAEINKIKCILIDRLGDRIDNNRPFVFWIIEIAQDGRKRSWICDNLEKGFS